MKDIAKMTGLGLATVSSYLNGGNVREQNRIKIEAAIEELHFEVNEVARGLKTNRTKMIGIVIPELNNVFCAEIITEVEDVLRNHGYATIICDCRTDAVREAEAVEFLFRRRVDGLILMPSGKSGKHLERFLHANKPIVLIDRNLEDVACDSVLVDNQGAVQDAVERLLAAGHKTIGMIVGPEDVFTAKERYGGYEEALKNAGIPVEASLVVHGNYTIAGGGRAVKQLVEQNPEMTAMVISNYEMTVGAMIGCNEMGIQIPAELSVIGFDNLEFAKASNPKLSIVAQPTKEIGRRAAELILERMENSSKDTLQRAVKLKTSFVEGESVHTLSE